MSGGGDVPAVAITAEPHLAGIRVELEYRVTRAGDIGRTRKPDDPALPLAVHALPRDAGICAAEKRSGRIRPQHDLATRGARKSCF